MLLRWRGRYVAMGRCVLAAVLLLSGVGKMMGDEHVSVAGVLLGDAPTLMSIAQVIEDLIPGAEVFVACALVLGRVRVLATGLAACLGIVFVLVAFTYPEGRSCGCFGALGGFESRGAHLAVALVIAMTAVWQVVVALMDEAESRGCHVQAVISGQ